MTDKRAPVQGYSAGIPWEMHLRAYDAYCKKYGSQPALIDLEGRNCRGGFGTEELDQFIPDWRDELSETVRLLRRAEAAEAEASVLLTVLKECTDVLETLRRGHGVDVSAACYPALNNARTVIEKHAAGAPHKPAGNGD